MFRKTKCVIVLVLLVICGGNVCAQYNSDYKTVAKKKIKTASSYDIVDKGDTLFYRYIYDTEGRLIETQHWVTDVNMYTYTYSTSGRMVGYTSLLTENRNDSGTYVNGKYIPINDTIMMTRSLHDENTWDVRYNQTISYLYGKRTSRHLYYFNGDTSFSYKFEEEQLHMLNFSIRLPVDTLKHAYSETYWGVDNRNNQNDTTLLDCEIVVVDRHGYPIKYYEVSQNERDRTDVLNPDGTLYSPIDDPLSSIKLTRTRKNYYRRDGSLDYYITTNTITHETDRREGAPHPPVERINSLVEIQNYGPTTFEYYQ